MAKNSYVNRRRKENTKKKIIYEFSAKAHKSFPVQIRSVPLNRRKQVLVGSLVKVF